MSGHPTVFERLRHFRCPNPDCEAPFEPEPREALSAPKVRQCGECSTKFFPLPSTLPKR